MEESPERDFRWCPLGVEGDAGWSLARAQGMQRSCSCLQGAQRDGCPELATQPSPWPMLRWGRPADCPLSLYWLDMKSLKAKWTVCS